jgi:hypothetical protein
MASLPRSGLPPEIRRFSGLYRFISPENFGALGIDPADVPLGAFPSENHPPFLPDPFGGNAYGLGFYERTALPDEESDLLERLDLDDPAQVAPLYSAVNHSFKRLGLLTRFSKLGRPYYLIPRQFVAHFLTEVQAKAEVISEFLARLLSRRLRETMRVGLATADYELLLPELQYRMPHLEFLLLDSLEALTARRRRPLQALIMVGDPREFALADLRRTRQDPPSDREGREAYGHFLVSRFYDLLEEGGEVLAVCDRPLGSSRESLLVTFRRQDELKRFLLFSHVYRTRRRYQSREGLALSINRFDFNAFLAGLGIYHETLEGLLGGRSLPQVTPPEIDTLPYQDLPLPRGSAPRLLSAWRRWFEPLFGIRALSAVLPQAQHSEWEDRYLVQGEYPATLVVMEAFRRPPAVSLAMLESAGGRRQLVGCELPLLAGYKDSLHYVGKVLDLLAQVRDGAFQGMGGLELSRLRKPFETVIRQGQLSDVLQLMEMAPRLRRLEGRLNPQGILGPRTPVMANLEKLSLLGVPEGVLGQIYLIVLGHSTMSRVTFGKLPETTLRPLTELARYPGLEEAIGIIRLYRLLSVAESAAAAESGLSPEQAKELFDLYDMAVQIVTNTDTDWNDLLDEQIIRLGGVQAKATRKMLKLFDLFEYLDRWRDLEGAGPRLKEALADYDPDKLWRIQSVIDMLQQVRRFVGRFYAGDSSARPYFFRALLNCELHGTGRLLPSLGTTAGFPLLWICVHTSERRLINFNPLLNVERPEELPGRLEKLRRALLGLSPELLSPEWLAKLREAMTQGREAYVHDSGLFLTLDPQTGALTPRFVDVLEELARFKQDLNLALGQHLLKVPDRRLGDMDRRSQAVGRFIDALRSERSQTPSPVAHRPEMNDEYRGLRRQLEHYLLEELFDLPTFAVNLRRLVANCPHLAGRLLPQGAEHPLTKQRLAAAAKLGALHERRLDAFEDLEMSHEMARSEFGPAATGIVGVSPLQFQELSASLTQLVSSQPRLGLLLMVATLLYGQQGETPQDQPDSLPPLTYRQELARAMRGDLDFLLAHHDIFRQVAFGEAGLASLQPILDCQDPPLMEALFLLAVVTCASRQEGLLTEDLLDRFFSLRQMLQGLTRGGGSARQAQETDLQAHARQHLAFDKYLELQQGDFPTVGLAQMLQTVQLPSEGQEELLAQGRRDAGLDRLLSLRGLYNLSFLDLKMLRHGMPVAFIYRLKVLHSMGAVRFERDLFEGLRLYRGMTLLQREHQNFVLDSLADPARPIFLHGFASAAERLTYPNQIRMLLLALAAAAKLGLEPNQPFTVSFWPLARVMETKFEVVNEAFSQLDPADILNKPRFVHSLVGAPRGLTLGLDRALALINMGIADLARIDSRIEAVRRASTPVKLKRLYHQELKKLKLTSYSTLDYQQRLEAAFNENLARQAELLMEKARQEMARENDLDRLEGIFQKAWEEGLELPLGQDRQHSLRDLFELNMERVRAELLEDAGRRLAQVKDFTQLDEMWRQVRHTLAVQRRRLGKDFDLILATRFDQRAQELRARQGPSV